MDLNKFYYTRLVHPHKGGIFAPQKAGDVGYDLAIANSATIQPGEIAKLSTGVRVALPAGFWGLVTVRSSVGLRGLLLASSGVVDNGYRGIVYVPLVNVGTQLQEVKAGDRVAQLLLLPLFTPVMEYSPPEEVTVTERGDGGFGSTGR
jgi:dUTP pyrophosphatase